MAGDYLFPKRLFREGEPLETFEVNSALVVPAERLNGHLNPHNIRAPINDSVLAAAGTFYSTATVVRDVDSGVSHQNTGPRPQDAFDVAQNTSWQVIGGEPAMAVEVESGKSTLAMTAHVSHCYQNADGAVREAYRFEIPTLADMGIDPDQYSKARRRETLSVEVSVFLDAPGSTTASRTYVLLLGLTPTASAFSQLLAYTIADPARDDASLFAGDVTFTPGGALPTTTSYAIANSNGGGYSVDVEFDRSRSDVVFTSLRSTAGTGTFKLSINVNYVLGGTGLSVTKVVSGDRIQDNDPALSNSNFSDLDAYAAGTKTLNYFAAQVQYAFRVDGAVLSESITGRFDNELRTVRPLKRQEPLAGVRASTAAATNTPVSAEYNRFPNRPDAVNIPMYSTRLTASVEVEPGAHLVELVVRRVPCGKRREFELTPPPLASPLTPVVDTDHRAMIYNRMLSVTEIPIESAESSLFREAVTVATYDDEDVVDSQSLYTDRLQSVADKSNEVRSFQVARGAINGDHLGDYSTVLAVAQGDNRSTNYRSSDFPYVRRPGTFALTNQIKMPQAVVAGLDSWGEIVSAQLTQPLKAGTACTLTVEGNVFLSRLQTDAPNTKLHTGGAFFCIALRANGVDYLYFPSLGWSNSNNYLIQKTGASSYNLAYLSNYYDRSTLVQIGDDYVDVPVTAVLQFEASGNNALLKDITHVAIYGAAAYMADASAYPGTSTLPADRSNASVRVARSSINAIAVKS